MRNLHEKLMRESNWYNSWHSHRGHGLAHWFLFFFIALLITSAVSEGINRSYLTENLGLSAAAVNATMPLRSSKVIPGQYIIVFKDGVKDPKGLATQLTKEHGGELIFAYENTIKGFAARIPDVAINGLKRNPNIEYVEQDQTVQASVTQSPATVGLDRIDQLSLPLDNSYTYNYTGAGVHAYVIDTGIRSTHTEFAGRMGNSFDNINVICPDTVYHWHGTHVAGTIGGTTVGVAKNVTLHSVRVLDCGGSGTTAGVIAGVDWLTANKIAPAVANMSLVGGFSQALNDAVKNSINSGITYVVAAGNSASDACFYSPASESTAITVGSMIINNDTQSSFSNWGTCLDIYAPGSTIYSANSASDTAMSTASGTSMASPHVAGVAALYLQANPSASPSQVTTQIISKATTGSLVLSGAGSPNVLLNSLFNGSAVTPPPSGDTQPPSTPTGLSASATGPGSVNLSWTGSTDNVGTTGYKIYRNSVQIATQPMAGYPTAYTDNAATAGTSYMYNVASYDAAGNTSPLSNTASVTTPNTSTPPAGTPVDIISYSVLNILSTTATIKWETNIPTHGTLVITTRKEAPRTFTLSNDSTQQYVYPTGLKPNTQYSYTITATNNSTTDTVTGTFKTRR